MAKTHNKKRNVGVIYELLLRHISRCLVESNNSDHKIAKKILRKHYKTDTEIYKEFRIFNALVKTTVSSDAVAGSIIREAKQAIRELDVRMLEREKSLLIRDINYKLNSESFYAQFISEYRMYATIQTLFNDWRAGANADLGRVAKYEDSVVTWLLKEKAEDGPIDTDSEVDNLVVKIMIEKFNDKFSDVLNVEQKDIVRDYVFVTSDKDHDERQLRSRLEEVRNDTLSCLSEYSKSNESMRDKIDRTREQIIAETIDAINDETIKKFLQLSQLKNEIEAEVNNER